MSKKQKKMLTRIIIAAVMLIALHFIPVTGLLRLALYLVVYIIIGYDILRKAGKGILNRRVFDENFLMAVATVGAFALEVGAADPAATVSEQEAAKSHRLDGGEKIGEEFVEAKGTVYTLSGNYTKGITIETKQDITINIDDEVTITGVAKFLHVTGTGKVTINGTKDGADQNIKMKTDCDVMNTGDTGIVYLDAAGADVTCNGGDYYSEEMSDADSTYSVFCVKDGSLKLNAVTAEAGKRTDVVDCGETNSSATNSSASVEIHGGSFKASGISSGVIDCNSKGTIYNATLEMHNEIMCLTPSVRVRS